MTPVRLILLITHQVWKFQHTIAVMRSSKIKVDIYQDVRNNIKGVNASLLNAVNICNQNTMNTKNQNKNVN